MFGFAALCAVSERLKEDRSALGARGRASNGGERLEAT